MKISQSLAPLNPQVDMKKGQKGGVNFSGFRGVGPLAIIPFMSINNIMVL